MADFYYNGTTPLDTSSCYGFFQATYTSDAGMTNISHLPLDYLVDYAGNLETVGHTAPEHPSCPVASLTGRLLACQALAACGCSCTVTAHAVPMESSVCP